MHIAAKNVYENIVKFFLDSSAGVNMKSDNLRTLFHEAIISKKKEQMLIVLLHRMKENDEVIKILVENGADLSELYSRGKTVLHDLVKKVNYEINELLLEKGASVTVSF